MLGITFNGNQLCDSMSLFFSHEQLRDLYKQLHKVFKDEEPVEMHEHDVVPHLFKLSDENL